MQIRAKKLRIKNYAETIPNPIILSELYEPLQTFAFLAVKRDPVSASHSRKAPLLPDSIDL